MSRSSAKAAVALTVALTLGGVASAALLALFSTYEERIESARRPEDRVMVMVAARDLYPGVPITVDDLVAVELAPRLLPSGVYLTPEHLLGQRPKERILANEFVRSDRLANPDAGDGLNAVIPSQMRALSVEVANGAAVSGFVDPGNYVDLLVTLGPESESTRTIAQDVFVLGVNGESTSGGADERGARKPSITILVTPELAEQVAHAERIGELRFTLRADNDRSLLPVVLQQSYEPEVRRVRQAPPPPPVEDDPQREILIINGPKTEREAVDDTASGD
ncbi:MAG: Flp pilus assembly protein CpaB [Alphaproteobacteria bacterium]|nr:Flp pilus assembly protein CpaB [Alphaproteobacteria bacterium]